MTNRNPRSRKLAFFLIALVVLAGFQPRFAEAQDAEQIRKAAEQGVARAQFNLGFMYATGRGVLKDEAEAVRWYRLAAEQGDAHAQYNLGLMYDEGTGVLEDYQEAEKWYRLAAEQGGARAQNSLAVMCLQVEKLECDFVKSYAWLVLSAAQGNKNAAKNKDRLKKMMDRSQVFKAQRLAAKLLKRIESSKP